MESMQCRDNTNAKVWISKINLNVAYRRLYVHPRWAVTSCSGVDNIAYILSTVPFGVSADLSKFLSISKAIVNLIYDLLLNDTWDPNTLIVDGWDNLDPPPTAIGEDQLGRVDPLMVEIPENNYMCNGKSTTALCLEWSRTKPKPARSLNPLNTSKASGSGCHIPTHRKKNDNGQTVFGQTQVEPTAAAYKHARCT